MISDLLASGASVKVSQTLARHSTPSLTIGLHAKASLQDINGAMDSLPDPGMSAPMPEAKAATVTEDQNANISKLLFPAYAGDGTGRNPSVTKKHDVIDMLEY